MTAEIATASRHSSPRDPLARFARTGHIHLGDDQQLGSLGQGRAVLRQLIADRPVVFDRVRAVQRQRLDQMNQNGCPLDMAEELVAQTVAGVRALDQSGNVGHDEIVLRRDHGSQIGILRRERIIGDFGMSARNPRQERRFAGVGQPDQARRRR